MQVLYDTVSRRLRPRGEKRRQVIVSLVQSCAGVRYSELARRAGLAHCVLTHHIKILERQKRTKVKRDRTSMWLFPDSYDKDLCDALACVSHPTTTAILTLLMKQECNFNQVKNAIKKSGSTVHGHLKQLHSAGLVSRRRRIDRKWVYGVKNTEKAIMIANGRCRNWQEINW